MRILLICIFMAMSNVVVGGDQIRIVKMSENMVTQIIFKSDIESFRGGMMPSEFAIIKENNVLYIQPTGSFFDTNINVITDDGNYYAFKISYSVNATNFNIIINTKEAIYNANIEPLRTSENIVVDKVDSIANTVEYACKAILQKDGYLNTNNVAKERKFAIIVKGVYVDSQHVFIRLIFDNDSNIGYDFETLTFNSETKKTGRTSSQEKIQLIPIAMYNFKETILPNDNLEVVCVFPKFTINSDKIVLISSIEKDGERNIRLTLKSKMIIDAKTY